MNESPIFKDRMRNWWSEKSRTEENGMSHPVLVRKVPEPDEEPSKPEVEIAAD